VKTLAIVAVACTVIAGNATAQQMQGHGGGGWGQGGGGHGGWGQSTGVFVDIPWQSLMAGANTHPGYDRCREVRHSCFDRWGVDEPGYGRCMDSCGC
jgi:hypothetical protein